MVCVIVADIGLILSFSSSDGMSAVGFLAVIRLFRIARLFRLARFMSGLSKLCNAFILSIPKLVNVGGVFALMLFFYSIVGINLFAKVRGFSSAQPSGQPEYLTSTSAIFPKTSSSSLQDEQSPALIVADYRQLERKSDYDLFSQYEPSNPSGRPDATLFVGEHNRHANFKTFADSVVTLFRACTGEAWNVLMHDLAGSAFTFRSILEVQCVDQMDLEGHRDQYFGDSSPGASAGAASDGTDCE